MNRKIFILLVFSLIIYLPLVYCEENWKSQRSNRFIVYYKDAPDDFIQEVIDTAEEYYRSITNELGFTRFSDWLWENRATIYIYNDSQEYLDATKQPSWSAGLAAYRERKITTFLADSGFFDTLLPHELGHIIFREFVGFRSGIPQWFEEGVASYQEKAKRVGATKALRQAIAEKKFIPLTELEKVSLVSSQDKDFVELFYSESGSVVYFLLTRFSKHNFVDLCKALKEGKSFEQALHDGYPRFDNVEELNREWVRYLQNE